MKHDSLQQSLVMPLEPMQELTQECGFALKHVSQSQQQSQHESEVPIEVNETQRCAVVDTELPDEGQEKNPHKQESLTEMLFRSDGDVRPLLINQPPSSFLATTSDDEGKSAGQVIAVGKQDENEEEEEEEDDEPERFVRPPHLRFTLSKETASDGFPSPIALSRRWHPDHMQDLPGDANLSIRAAFDTKFDEYYVFRHWRPSSGATIRT